MATPFQNVAVAMKFEGYPVLARSELLALRELIFTVAKATPGVRDVEECLRWGEPAYLSKSGSTIRIAWKAKAADRYAMYFNCQTTLVDSFRGRFPNEFAFEGNRALVFPLGEAISRDALATCIGAALTYHLSKLNL
jgi:Domain of unknown function (DU1801)